MKKLTTLILFALFVASCAESQDETLETSNSLTGSWSVTMSVRNNIPCEGQIDIASNRVGGWWCQDTTPISPGLYRITYGTSQWTASGSAYTARITDHGGGAIFSDTVTITGSTMDGAIINGDRL